MSLNASVKLVVFVACLVTLAACAPPQAARPPDAAGRRLPLNFSTIMDTAVPLGLFGQVCIANAGNPPAIEAELRRLEFRPLAPTAAAPYLMGTAGTAWMRPDDATGPVLLAAVVTRPSEVFCQVVSPIAVPALAALGFRRRMQELAATATVVLEREGRTSLAARPGVHLVYRVTQPGGTYRYSLSAHDPVPGRVAMAIFAQRVD